MRPLLLAALAASLAPAARADDWPQWMGPTRDGVWAEAGVADALPANGPTKLWSAPVGGGYSGPAVADGVVYLTDYVRASGDADNNPAKRAESKGAERVLAFDAKSGKQLWKHEYPVQYSVSYPAGPRCTPTVSGGKVYALGAMGNLVCLEAGTGKPVWSKNFVADYSAPVPIWGFSGHPLVYKNLLICLVGGDGTTAVAFDKETGAERWRRLSAPEPGYCPPTLIQNHGAEQVVIWHAKSVNGLDPLTGERKWEVPLAPNYGMSIMAPRQSGDLLFAGGIMGKAAVIRLLAPDKAEVVWSGTGKNALYPVNATPYIDGGVIFGVDQPGALRAVKLASGERLWSTYVPVTGEEQEEGFRGAGSGTAFLVRQGDKVWLFSETGHLILAKLSPEKYEELGRSKLLEPTGEAFGRKVVWSHPAFALKCVFARNDKELVCYSLAK